MSKSTMHVFLIVIFIGTLQWSGSASSQQVSVTSSDEVTASYLHLLNRIRVIVKLLSLDSKDADSVRIMNLYKLDELEPKKLELTITQLSKVSSEEPHELPILLIRDTTNRDDFMGKRVMFGLPTGQNDPSSLQDATKADSRAHSWDRFIQYGQKVLTGGSQAKIQDESLYVATEQKLEGLVPESRVVVFDSAPQLTKS